MQVRAYRWSVRFRNRHPWLPAAGAVLATAGGSFAAVFILDPAGNIRWWPFGLALAGLVAAAAITISLEVLRARAQRREQGERAQFQVALNDAVIPILDELGAMAEKDSRGRQSSTDKVVSYMSGAAALVLPEAKRVRTVIYELKPPAGTRKRHLHVVSCVGRGDKARDFKDGDGGRGSAVFEWLDDVEAGTVFVDDLKRRHPPEWQGSGRGYKTFISAKIRIAGTAVGMLAVDAPQPGDLDESDKVVVEVLAALVAATWAEARR